MARKLQNRLALAQFKTNRGWEDLPLDTIEPKVEEELRRRRPMSSGDILSDSSSSSTASDFHYVNSRTLMSSPLKSSTFFSDQIGSSGGSTGHRKRMYHGSFDLPTSSFSSRKRFRSSPTAGRSMNSGHRQLAQSSPIKPRKQPHFTTSAGPDLSFYRSSHADDLHNTNFAAPSDDEDDVLPTHSFNIHSSPPRTPPPRNRGSLGRRSKDRNGKSGEEGADLLLFLATSPSPANPTSRARMQPPSTPPPKNMALPSSMMTTPGGGGGLLSVFNNPHTPSQQFDFSDFVNITPSPGQRAWPKTPAAKTPLTAARRLQTFETFLPPNASPNMRDQSTTKHAGLGMQLGGDLIS
jgi:hypothetical protein